MKRPFRHKWIRWTAAALSLSLLAVALSPVADGRAGPLRSGMETVSRPFLRLFSPVTEKIRQAETWFQGMEALAAENEALRADLAQAERAARSGTLARRENQRLRDLLDWSSGREDLTLLDAWVLARTPDNWQRSVTLDRGCEDGAAAGQCVVDQHGALVGRVTQVGQNWCQVSLVTDPAFRVTAVGVHSEVLGTVEGDLGRLAAGETTLTGLTQTDPLQLGEPVVTFAAQGAYPAGLLVGTVTSLAADPGGLTQRGILTPAADLERLGQVFLVTAFREEG